MRPNSARCLPSQHACKPLDRVCGECPAGRAPRDVRGGCGRAPVYSIVRHGRAPTARGVSPARSCRRDKPPSVLQATAAASAPRDQALPRQHTLDRSSAWHARWRVNVLAGPGSVRGASNRVPARNFRSLALYRCSGGRWRCRDRHYVGTAALAGVYDDLLLVRPSVLRLLDVGARQGERSGPGAISCPGRWRWQSAGGERVRKRRCSARASGEWRSGR